MKKIELTIEQAEFLLDAVRRLQKLIDLIETLWSIRADTARKLTYGKPINVTPMIDYLVYSIQKAKEEEKHEKQSLANE